MDGVQNKQVALMASDGFEDSELKKPMAELKDAGVTVTVFSDKSGSITGKNGESVAVDAPLEDLNVQQYDGLLLPGGVANPDTLRMNKTAVSLVVDFVDSGKPVAAICHAPWLLIEAGKVSGKAIASWPSLKTDLMNAGATWKDEQVVEDGNLITSRNPNDIPDFTKAFIKHLSR